MGEGKWGYRARSSWAKILLMTMVIGQTAGLSHQVPSEQRGRYVRKEEQQKRGTALSVALSSSKGETPGSNKPG
jgi:hypothetical protein